MQVDQSNYHTSQITSISVQEGDHLITTSHDRTIRFWEGTKVRSVTYLDPYNTTPGHYQQAACLIHRNLLVTGSTNGKISFHSFGNIIEPTRSVSTWRDNEVTQDPKRTLGMVTCLAKHSDLNHQYLLVGLPSHVQIWDTTLQRKVRNYQVSSSADELYCIQSLTYKNALLSIGGNLEVWQGSAQDIADSFTSVRTLHKEQPSDLRGGQRPFISSLTTLDPHHVAVTLLSGQVQVCDVEQAKTTRFDTEHTHRVWTSSRVSHQQFITGDDVGTVKLWDVRQRQSALTLESGIGRISAMANHHHGILFAGGPINRHPNLPGKAVAELRFLEYQTLAMIQ